MSFFLARYPPIFDRGIMRGKERTSAETSLEGIFTNPSGAQNSGTISLRTLKTRNS